MVSRNFAALAMPGIQHGAQRAVEAETEIVAFVDQQRSMLAVSGVVNAGGSDAVGFQRTHTEGLNEVEERGLAAAANRTGQRQPRRHRKSLIDESVHDPERLRAYSAAALSSAAASALASAIVSAIVSVGLDGMD